MAKDEDLAALARLIAAADGDTGQAGRARRFLLAWWNADHHGGFDLTDLWNVDRAIADDMVRVFWLVSRAHLYPDAYGFGPQMERLAQISNEAREARSHG